MMSDMTNVFLDYTQKALDDAYDQAVYAANRDQILARLAATSELVRKRIVAPITIVYGSLETPEFQRQAREFATALEQAGKPFQLVRAKGYNHFEIAETLSSPYGPLGRAVLEQMGLGGL
jgi:arylformamidase